MLRAGKLENIKQEIKCLKINILQIIFYESAKGQFGAAIILDQTRACTIDKICFERDTLMMVRLKGKPVNVVIVQVCMETTDYKDDYVDAVYERIEELLDKETKGNDYKLVMGDWNAVAGRGKEDTFGGHYGLGYRNDIGEKLVEFGKRRP